MARKAGKGGVIVTGIPEIDRKLKTLVPRLQKKVIRQAMRKAMALVTEEARARVPVDTGELRKAIKTRAAKRRRRGEIGVDTRVGEGDFKGETFYGGMVEFGTSKMPPRPFMAPAYDGKKDEARRIATDEILKGVEREASQG